MKKIIFIVIGLVIIVGLIIGFVNKQSNIATSPEQIVTVVNAIEGTASEKNIFGALVKNSQEAIISTQISGNVQAIYVQEGDVVKKGQLLASVSAPEMSARYQIANNGVQIAQQDEMLARRKWDDLKPEERERFKLQTEQSISYKAEVSAALSKSRIVAPFDGIISKKYVTQGKTVMPGTQIIYMVGNTNHKEVVIDVPINIGNAISVGDKVTIVSGDNEADANIIAISPVSDEMSRKMIVRIALDNNAPFELGEFVDVVVSKNIQIKGIKVPKESIVSQYSDSFVFVLNNEIAEMKSVNILGESDGFAIVEGIESGDNVIVSGAHNLQDGQKVIVSEE